MNIDKIRNIGLDKLVTQVYDFDSLTTDELMCKFAQKINIIIEHLKYIDDRCYNSDKAMEEKLQYLLGQGLEEQVAKRFIELINDGTLGNLINEDLIKDFTNQLIPLFYDGAIVTFIDDDCYSSVTKWEEIANNKGIKLSFAMVKNWVGTSGYCTIDKIKSLQYNGHDILNHTYSHINNWDITDGEIRTEIENNINYMKNNGLTGYDVLVYPGTVPNENRYKNIVREYCKYGIANTYQSTDNVQDNFYMNRIDSDYRSLSQLKEIIDQAIINKQWVLIMTHSWRPDGGIDSTGTFSVEKITQLIDYIQSKNIPILKFTDAEKYKGNSISIGDYNKGGIYIAKDGKNNVNHTVLINASNIEKTGTDYLKDKITIETIRTPDDTIFNTGGILITNRSSQANFSFQLYFLWNSNAIYKRRWLEYDNVWTDFERSDKLIVNNNLTNTSLMDAPITNYEVDSETIVIIRTAIDTFKNVGGTMKVFRSSQANFSYATFVPWNESAMYIRHWAENSQWGEGYPKWTDWVKTGA